jgi:hypothetical protein
VTTPLPPDDAALEYYYHGFLRTLRHHRIATIAGWLIAAAGGAGVFTSCRAGEDLLSTAIPLSALCAGIALVQQSVARLDAYIAIPFPAPDPETIARLPLLAACAALMQEVDSGGWQEAYAALRTLRGMPAAGSIMTGRETPDGHTRGGV